MKKQLLKRAAQVLILGFLLLVIATVLYFLAAYALGGWTVNQNFKETPDGIRIFVVSNGAHADIVLPREGWQSWIKPDHFLGPDRGRMYLGFGWGHRTVYENVPTWDDLTLGMAFCAAVGIGDVALHVRRLPELKEGKRCKSLLISASQHEKLCAYVQNTFQKAEPEPTGFHYHENDTFYPSKGSYTILNTCNTWAGRGLKQAGIRTAVWTPLPGQVVKSVRPKESSPKADSGDAKLPGG